MRLKIALLLSSVFCCLQQVYWLAVLARAAGQMHLPIEIFPARLADHALDQLVSGHRAEPQIVQFWENLKEGFDQSKNITVRRLFGSAGVESTYSATNEIRRRPVILLRFRT
jgi:hypothetical protein